MQSFSSPEDIVAKELIYDCHCEECAASVAHETVKQLRLAGWIRSVDERNAAIGQS